MTDRRQFLRTTAVAAGALPLFAVPVATAAAPTKKSAAETAVKALFDTLTDKQKAEVCFAWDHTEKDGGRGLLRTHVSNNWQITKPTITGGFYTKAQQTIVHDIFKGLIHPDWYEKFLTQLKDDNGGKPWGSFQSLAVFGEPGGDKFECVLTGRHQTLRADGNTEKHVAFGGPIFYGHASEGFDESAKHYGNVFWPQAVAANGVYKLLDEKQQKQALVAKSPKESAVAFRGKEIEKAPGLAIAGLSDDVKKDLAKVLEKLIEPFRTEDRDEVMECLKAQGGLDKCVLSFFADADIGEDKVWDNWRIEGPAFVWYFRGAPHVHVWVNVADSPDVKTNARG